MAEITTGNSFEPNNPTEQKLGYVRVIECEITLIRKSDPKELKFIYTLPFRSVHIQYHATLTQFVSLVKLEVGRGLQFQEKVLKTVRVIITGHLSS